MQRLGSIVMATAIVLTLAACSAVESPPTASPSAPELVSASENGNVGICHSVSIALSSLDAVELGYQDGTLRRADFDYMVKAIAKDFTLLKILHKDATFGSTANDLGAAIGDLATAGVEPALGDTSKLGQRRSALATACDSVGASLSVVQ